MREKYDAAKPVMEMFSQMAKQSNMTVEQYVAFVRTEAKKSSGMEDLLGNVNAILTKTLISSATVPAALNVQYLPYIAGVDMMIQVPASTNFGIYSSLIRDDPCGYITPLITTDTVYNYIRGKMSCCKG